MNTIEHSKRGSRRRPDSELKTKVLARTVLRDDWRAHDGGGGLRASATLLRTVLLHTAHARALIRRALPRGRTNRKLLATMHGAEERSTLHKSAAPKERPLDIEQFVVLVRLQCRSV